MCSVYRKAKNGNNLINKYPQYIDKISLEAKLIQATYHNYLPMMKIAYDSGTYRCEYYQPE